MFDFARDRAKEATKNGIGTLSERILHRTLKYYIEPNDTHHETEHLGYVADILTDTHIYEIQTRSLSRLLPKLERFTADRPVSIIYPIAVERTISWVDESTGEATPKRKVSKKGRASDALLELYPLTPILTHENLTVHLFMIRSEEYKALNGKGASRKRGATRIERIPTELLDIISLHSPSDYLRLIPDKLPDTFTAAEFYRATAMRGRRSYYALKLLCDIGVLTREKQGRAYLYKRCAIPEANES